MRIGVECAAKRRNLIWISLQSAGWISIGFVDQAVVVRPLISERDEENSTELDLTSRPAEAVTDPHFTFKPPNYFHLRSKKHPDILEGLVWTTPPHGQRASPWLRFVSHPVKKLTPFTEGPARRQGKGKLMGLAIPSEDMSVRVHFDFVSAEGDTVIDGRTISEFIEWQGITLHCYAYAVPGQSATLGYSILG